MSVRTAHRRIALLLALGVAWVAGSAIGATQPVRRAAAAPLFQIEQAHAEFVPVLDGSKPIFILVIGSDARPDEQATSTRADSIHIVAVNLEKHKATIVGIPRDSYVEIPGHGSNKINASMFYGGPELVVKTVENLTGLTMDYWALTGFKTFEQMVNGIDGLVVDVPFAMNDSASGAFFEPGVQRLSGADALAFARNRHGLPSGDFGRSENQGTLLISALHQMKKEFNKDPNNLLTWVASFMRRATTQLPLDDVLDLAFTGTTINPEKVVNIVVTGGVGMVGSMSVVNLDQAQVDAVSRDLKDDGLLKAENIGPSQNASLLGP